MKKKIEILETLNRQVGQLIVEALNDIENQDAAKHIVDQISNDTIQIRLIYNFPDGDVDLSIIRRDGTAPPQGLLRTARNIADYN